MPGAFERFDGVYFPNPVLGEPAIFIAADWQETATGQPTPSITPALNNFEKGLLYELRQNFYTISFLYECLEGNSKHAYPYQTKDRLKQIKGIMDRVGLSLNGCIHSFTHPECPECQTAHQFRKEHKFDERLGW